MLTISSKLEDLRGSSVNITALGLYEIEIKTAVRRFVKPGDCCYDLGSARGYYTLALAKLSYPRKVYSVDGSSEACEIIQKNYALNQKRDFKSNGAVPNDR